VALGGNLHLDHPLERLGLVEGVQAQRAVVVCHPPRPQHRWYFGNHLHLLHHQTEETVKTGFVKLAETTVLFNEIRSGSD